MYQVRIAITKLALFALLAIGLMGPAQAQQMRINAGCPGLSSPDVGKMSVDELKCRCYSVCEGSQASVPEQVADSSNGAALTCGQHKTLAAQAARDSSFVEGQVSRAIVAQQCAGVPDSAVPGGSVAGGQLLSGIFEYERGYFNSYSGRKGDICRRYYSGRALISGGVIEFVSGGHTWTGRITDNSFIQLTREGIDPRPKNPTAINGPMVDATMYNGYCGSGFFRLKLGG